MNHVFYIDGQNNKKVVFKGTLEECILFCEKYKWKYQGNKLKLWV